MKRTLVLVGVLAAIIVAVIVMAGKQSDADRSFEDYEGNFAVEDISAVNRIVITRGRNTPVELKLTREGWVVNDGYKARMGSIEPLLDAIQLVQIKYIPPQKAEDHIKWDISANGIQVDVYDKSDDLLKSYFVGGANFDESGTHALMNGSDQPFVVHMPTMDGSIRARFTLTADEWRDLHFIDFTSEDIESVSVEYNRQKSQSFRIERKEEGFDVSALHPELRSTHGNYRQGTAERFLRALTNLACESYKNEYPFLDSIRTLVPISTINVVLHDNSEPVTINVYPQGEVVSSEFTGPIHWMFFDARPGDFVGAQYHVVEGMLKGYDFFLDGPEQELVFR